MPTRAAPQPLELLDRFGPEAHNVIPPSLPDSLHYVRTLAASHYENFSVLSRLVPPDLRDDFAAVYAFCRWSDDLADETGRDDAARARSLQLLAWWRGELAACFRLAREPRANDAGRPTHPVFVALADTARRRHALPRRPFDDLISAFELDQRVRFYSTWDQLLAYCRLSANPVGRIVLALAGYADTPENAHRYAMSDATCTALQLANHWQDVRRDLLDRDRVYLPSEDTAVTPDMLRGWAARPDDPRARLPYIRALRPLVARTGELFDAGRPLPHTLDHRIGPVVGLLGAGGQAVLRLIQRTGCTTLWNRPTLGAGTRVRLVASAWLRARLGTHRGARR